MRTRTLRRGASGRLQKSLEREIAVAVESIRDLLTPRAYVYLMTMSSFELGCEFKAALRDELYELRHRVERRRTTALEAVEKR